MENFTSIEIATVVVLSALMGGFIKEIASSLFKRWTTEYTPKKEFDAFKQHVDKTYKKKEDDHAEKEKIFNELEEVKKILVIIALKLNVDISKAQLTVSLNDIREALKEDKDEKQK